MSEQIKDGGPAFPSAAFEGYAPEFGMLLRDWFAGQALAGMSALPIHPKTPINIAHGAYAVADAMLAARSK